MQSTKQYSCALAAFAVALAVQTAGAAPGGAQDVLEFQQITSPAEASTFLPQITRRSNGDLVASWMQSKGKDYVFQLSVRHANQWSPSRTIASGPELSHFTADLPGVAELADGTLVAYWQLTDRSGSDDEATVIQIASSADEGRTWSKPSRPYRDATPGQHGFISSFRVGADLGLVWLDAQSQSRSRAASHEGSALGAIGLRNVTIDKTGRVKSDAWINPIVCECCPTSAIATAAGPVVVFRGRVDQAYTKPSEVHTDAATVRDIQIVRMEDGRWGKPHSVHADHWVFNGCPDNGPAVDGSGRDLVVAWWTAVGDRPKVQVAFSGDAGTHFDAPIRVDLNNGEGQVTVAWNAAANSAVVGWLEDHRVWARTVSRRGRLGIPIALGSTPSHARLPRWVSGPDGVLASWTGIAGEVRSVQFAMLRSPQRPRIAEHPVE